MKTVLDCVPCFIRQTLDAVRVVSHDPSIHDRILREALRASAELNWNDSPPVLAQRIHRRIRALTGIADPYHAAKQHWNRLALEMRPELQTMITGAPDRLAMAVRLAIAGNVIDLGVNGHVTEADLHAAIRHALDEPFAGDLEEFRAAVTHAGNILFLADNAGEIVFDWLLAEQLAPARVIFAVRGAPILNDVTRADVQAIGLTGQFEVIENGSDAPGTILHECTAEFRQRFDSADLIVAKGQGNFETLNDAPRDIFFLFKAKCAVVARHVGVPVGTQVIHHARKER